MAQPGNDRENVAEHDDIEPEDLVLESEGEPPHRTSITGAAVDALRTGLAPVDLPTDEIPGQDHLLRAGDPDVEPLEAEYSGETAPGGANSSPDQNNVDEIGRVYGVTHTDDGELVLGEDLVKPRDDDRWELDPASREE